MSKKDVEDEVIEKIVPSDVSVSFGVRKLRSYSSLLTNKRCEVVVPVSVYPPTQTEQIHHASISEQVRSGLGEAQQPENAKDYYDFPDGKDDGSDGIGVFEMSEPAEVFEREQEFTKTLRNAYNASKEGQSTKTSIDSEKSDSKQSSSVSEQNTQPTDTTESK